MMSSKARTSVRRQPDRAAYDWDTIRTILDQGLICHVGFAVDGDVFVIPMAYARDGDRLYLHGSSASRTMRALRDGAEACITVTVTDGLVLARSAMHHSMNYRSVVIFGTATEVTDRDLKADALRELTEYLVPGRSPDVRGPNAQELKATMVLEFPLVQASAKVRTGPPIDTAEDLDIDAWAGVIPLRTVAGPPVDSPDLRSNIPVPEYVHRYTPGARPSEPSSENDTPRHDGRTDARSGSADPNR